MPRPSQDGLVTSFILRKWEKNILRTSLAAKGLSRCPSPRFSADLRTAAFLTQGAGKTGWGPTPGSDTVLPGNPTTAQALAKGAVIHAATAARASYPTSPHMDARRTRPCLRFRARTRASRELQDTTPDVSPGPWKVQMHGRRGLFKGTLPLTK